MFNCSASLSSPTVEILRISNPSFSSSSNGVCPFIYEISNPIRIWGFLVLIHFSSPRMLSLFARVHSPDPPTPSCSKYDLQFLLLFPKPCFQLFLPVILLSEL